jgi:hypothetical protein
MGTQAQDLGQYSYDPTNQMFTLNGARTAPGTPTPTMSLADMQNRYQNPYQPPMPINRPGKFNPSLNTVPYEGPDPNQTVPMPPPGTMAHNTYLQTGRLPTYGEISRPIVEPARPRFSQQPFNPMNRPQQPTRPQMPQSPQQRGAFPGMPMNPAQPPQGPQQRGLGGLQIDKFRNRLGQR